MFDPVIFCGTSTAISGAREIFTDAAFSVPTNPLDAVTAPFNFMMAMALTPFVVMNKAVADSIQHAAVPFERKRAPVEHEALRNAA